MGFSLRSVAAACWLSRVRSLAVAFAAALAGVATGFGIAASVLAGGFRVGGGAPTGCLTGTAVFGAAGFSTRLFPDLAAVGATFSALITTEIDGRFEVGTGALAFLGVSQGSNSSSRFTEGFGTGGGVVIAAFANSTDPSVDALDRTVGGVTGLGHHNH